MNLLRLSFIISLALSQVYASALSRRATCTVTSAGSASTDDVPAIEAAIKSCGNGGIIVLSAGKTYQLRSTLDLTGCSGCEIQIEGTLKMSDDTTFWNGVRAAIMIDGIKGASITTKTGTGLVDGNGVPFWQKFASDSSFKRPTLVYIQGSSSQITISNLRFKNAPNVFHSVTGGSTNVLYSYLRLDATSTSDATAKNTDGFDVGSSKYVTIQHTTVTNQDDCVALKPGSDFAYVKNITCTGSHGLSVGSLAGGSGSTDTVTNAYLGPATMVNSAKAVGIKLYEGGSSHGVATVSNVTWSDITVKNCDYAAQIQSCYGSASTSECTSNPSKSTVTGVYFKKFSGTTSTKYGQVVANLNCPPSGTCNIFFENFSVKPSSGSASVLCSNVDSSLGLTCSGDFPMQHLLSLEPHILSLSS